MANTANLMWMTPIIPIVTNGLVLYYDPSNTSSYSGSGLTMNDLSGQNNTATLSTDNVLLPVWSSANGGIFQFSGVSGNDPYLNTPVSTSINDLSAMTVSMWLNFDTNTSLSHLLFYKSNNNTSAGWFIEYAGNVGSTGLYGLDFSVVVTSNSRYAIAQNQVPLGVWVNIVATWNGVFPNPTIQFYINNVLNVSVPIVNTTGSGSRTTDSAEPLNFALHRSTGSLASDFVGYAGVLQIYNRVLSSTEISQNFNVIRSKYGL